MANATLPVGPYRTLAADDGTQVPFYIIPFDEQGICQGPQTYKQLLTNAQSGNYSDILLFSHGWNNDWPTAVGAYEGFINGYMQLRQAHNLTYPRPFQPLLVGIFWPSMALVSPSGQAPAIAGLMDAAVAQERQEVQSLAATLDKADIERFYTLAQRQLGLNQDEALELAKMLLPLYNNAKDELPEKASPLSAEGLVKLWRSISSLNDDSGNSGYADDSATTARVAGIFDFLDPRNIIRVATVFQMKDRAGVVGAHGVGTLLADLLNNQLGRVHLIGHSYGCAVVLSALCYQTPPRTVNSVLLLEPAISYLCFADNVDGTGKPGGYRAALDSVEQPILTTFSSHDIELTQLFHLAVRRPEDLGEQKIAGTPPSKYAALGGYGPGGCGDKCATIDIQPVGQPYNLQPGTCKIYGVNGSAAIHGHTDISNDYTWWALYEQVVN